MKKLILGTIAFAAIATASVAVAADTTTSEVDKDVALMRQDVRAQKADILSKTMELDSAQAAKFWPIYKKYEAENQKLGDQKIAIIKDLAVHVDKLTNAKAKSLLDRSFAIEEKRIAVAKKYKAQMLKALPAITVARFFQIENRLNKLIELSVATEIPLVY